MDSNTDLFQISETQIPDNTDSEVSDLNSTAEPGKIETFVKMDEILKNILHHQKETNKVSLQIFKCILHAHTVLYNYLLEM